MLAKIYKLPEISFIGGETRDLSYRLLTESGKKFNATGATAVFSIVSSINRTGRPIVSKPMRILADDEGIECIAAVTLEPRETVGLSGKYIYQIFIQDISGENEIPGQGIFIINNNIDKALVV